MWDNFLFDFMDFEGIMFVIFYKFWARCPGPLRKRHQKICVLFLSGKHMTNNMCLEICGSTYAMF